MSVTLEPVERQIFRAALKLVDVDTTAGYTHMEGRAAPYGVETNRGWFLEGFADGLFDKSLKEAASNLPLLLWHDSMSWPVGSSAKWRSVPGDGLYGEWKLDGSADAQRAAQLAKDGHLGFLSVGYIPTRSTWALSDAEEWDPADSSTLDRVTRHEARLLETSMVTTPAFASAQILLVRTGERARRPQRAEHRPHLAEWRTWRSTIAS